MELSPNADYINMQDLAVYLEGRLHELVPQYKELSDNDRLKEYINGLLSAYENVLISIGYPVEQIPEYEDLI